MESTSYPRTKETKPGPYTSVNHAMTYDPHRGRMLLFVGPYDYSCGDMLEESIWQWDGDLRDSRL